MAGSTIPLSEIRRRLTHLCRDRDGGGGSPPPKNTQDVSHGGKSGENESQTDTET